MHKLEPLLPYIAAIPGDILAKEAHLKATLALKTRVVGNFMLLDYHQWESPRKHPIVDQCRGVVVRVDPENHALVEFARRPFDRFYNLGEYPEAEALFDWQTATVEEKADGSLSCVWHNRETGAWEIGTRGYAFGDNRISTLAGEESAISFRDLFLRAFGGQGTFDDYFASAGLPWLSYLFEVCTLENKIVTAYDGDTVYLLGIRDNVTGRDHSPAQLDLIAERMNLRRPKRYAVTGFDAVATAANALEGLQEGFVLRDIESRRIKVKSLAYVAAHHLRGEGVTPKRAVLLALAGEIDEFCSYFPEFAPLLEPYQQAVDETTDTILNTYDALRGIADQKAFALEACKHPFAALLFTLRKTGASLETVIAGLNESTKITVFAPKAVAASA